MEPRLNVNVRRTLITDPIFLNDPALLAREKEGPVRVGLYVVTNNCSMNWFSVVFRLIVSPALIAPKETEETTGLLTRA
jgi:hypothetical protein